MSTLKIVLSKCILAPTFPEACMEFILKPSGKTTTCFLEQSPENGGCVSHSLYYQITRGLVWTAAFTVLCIKLIKV